MLNKSMQLKYSGILTLVLMSNALFAEPLTNEALYNRCYAKLTNDVPPRDSVYTAVVQRDSSPTLGKDAIDACEDVFNKANFGTTDTLPKINGAYDPLGIKVLKVMYDLHRSFFVADNIQNAFPFNVADNPAGNSADIIDSNAGALYYTRALMRSDLPANYVVTTMDAPRAIRQSSINNASNRYSVFLSYKRDKVVTFGHITSWKRNGSSYTPVTEDNNLPIVPHGLLVGIENDKLNNSSKYYNGVPSDSNDWEDLMKTYEILNPPAQNISKNLGGGFLGNQSFMILNWGLPNRYFIDGGIKTPRRLAAAAYKVLFDRSVPLIKASQAQSLVDGSSPFPFRKSSSCMQCHATMDQFAYTYRNLHSVKSVLDGGLGFMVEAKNGVNVDFTKVPVVLNEELGPWPANDKYFHLRPTNGKLFFTNIYGTLIDSPVTSLSSLGNEVARQDDFYIAIAKRYFLFFTGIDVNISNLDINPIENDEFKSKKMEYRDFVIKLGQELKNDPKQSMRKMMFKILRSSAFKFPGKGVE